MSATRTTYVYKNNEWIQTKLKDVEVGDIIKMYESTGEPVLDGQVSEFLVVGKPSLNASGRWQCDISDTIENILRTQTEYILKIGLDKFLDLFPHYLPYEDELRKKIYKK